MRNARARRVIIDPLLAGKRFDFGVLLQILRCRVLNVVIDRENRLPRIRDRRRADLLELRHDRGGVVVRHDMARPNRNEISRAHHGSRREPIGMSRRNFFDERKAHNISWRTST